MKFNSANSKLQTPFELPTIADQESTKPHYRRRDFQSTFLPEDMVQNLYARYGSSNVADQKNSIPIDATEEILDPKKQDVEITDPKRDFPEREFPEQEEDDLDQTPDKIVPEPDKHYLIGEEGDIIGVPS